MESYLIDKRVLITGATGFIGSHLVARLLQYGCFVFALSQHGILRLISARPHPAFSLAALDSAPRLTLLRCDITDTPKVSDIIGEVRPEIVVHLAATGVSALACEHDLIAVNINGTSNLLASLEKYPPLNMIHVGSVFEYGEGNYLSETSPLRPTTVYGATKVAAHFLAHSYRRRCNLPIISVRPFVPFGPGDGSRRLIQTVVRHALKGEDIPLTPGEQERDFIYIDDVIDGILSVLMVKSGDSHEVFNLCRGEGVSVRKLVESVLDIMGHPVKALFGAIPYRDGEMWLQSGDPTLSRNVLGWQASTPLVTGLKNTVEWLCQLNRGRRPLALEEQDARGRRPLALEEQDARGRRPLALPET